MHSYAQILAFSNIVLSKRGELEVQNLTCAFSEKIAWFMRPCEWGANTIEDLEPVCPLTSPSMKTCNHPHAPYCTATKKSIAGINTVENIHFQNTSFWSGGHFLRSSHHQEYFFECFLFYQVYKQALKYLATTFDPYLTEELFWICIVCAVKYNKMEGSNARLLRDVVGWGYNTIPWTILG